MTPSTEIAELYRRDLTRLLQQIDAFPDDAAPWRVLPGIANSAGNLILHLEGNLREYIGGLIGAIPYTRHRDAEFSTTGISLAELRSKVAQLRDQIPTIIETLSEESLHSPHPEKLSGKQMSTHQYLLHLYGHFNYHLGQIDYLRRIANTGPSIPAVNLTGS